MARLARMEVFAPDEIAIVHVMNRVVRRCFLLGTDPGNDVTDIASLPRELVLIPQALPNPHGGMPLLARLLLIVDEPLPNHRQIWFQLRTRLWLGQRVRNR